MPRASPPFDSKDANLVLVSSDDVKFRVHRHTISLASSVLSELALAQQVTQPEPSKKHRQRPHVLLSEPSDALDLFLRFIYPIPEPPSLPLTSIATVLSLAQRYAAPSVVMRMRAHLMRPEHIDSYPLAVYTLVTSATMPAHMVAIARSAARRMLPRELPPGADLTGRLGLSGDALCQLLAYRRTCAAAAAKVVDARQEVPSWIRLEWKRFCFLSECGAGCARMPRSTRSWAKAATGYVVVPEWWLEYMEGVRKALATSGRVDSGVARDPTRVRAAAEKAGGCGKCAGKAVWDLQEFACFLERAIEEAIDSVSAQSLRLISYIMTPDLYVIHAGELHTGESG